MRQPEKHNSNIDEERSEWLKARERAAELANKLFQPGSGYGDPEARASDARFTEITAIGNLGLVCCCGGCWLGNHCQYRSGTTKIEG